VTGLDWVVVGEIERDEALSELDGYLRDVLLLAAILVPLVAAAGVWLASRATRPVDPLVAAAERVAAGDLDLGFRDDSRDEFGHLARQLVRRAEGLAAEDAALAQQRRAIDELLLAVLPDRLLEAVRSGQLDLGDLADTATVATITIDGLGAAEDEVVSLVASRLEVLAGVYRMERAWSSTDRHLYLAGLGRDDDHGCDDAVAFMREAFAVVTDLTGEAGLRVALHGALAAGDVATGIVGGERLALGVWGRAPRHALALDAAAPVGGVLVELGVVERAGDAGLPSAPTTTVQDGSETLDAVVWRPLLDDAVLGDDAPGEAISRPS
jgi:HAMP domain-containing protein